MANQTVGRLNIWLSASTAALARDLQNARKLVSGYATSIDKVLSVGRMTKAISGNFNKVSNSITSAAPALADFSRSAISSLNSIARTVNPFSAFIPSFETFKTLTVAGFVAIQYHAIRLAGELEQIETSFKVLVSGGADYKAVLTDLRQFAAETPFSQQEVLSGAKQLMAYGFAADQLIPTMKAVGDVASATNVSLDDMAYLFGTLRTQGRAYTIDIRQFAQRGIPIWDELAKVMGKNVGEMQALVEEGKVGFPQVLQAFKNMSSQGGKFNNMMEEQSKTLFGRLTALKDNVLMTLADIGTELINALGLKDLIQEWINYTGGVRRNIAAIRPYIREYAEWIKALGNVFVQTFRGATAIVSGFFKGLMGYFPDLKGQADSFRDGLKSWEVDFDRVEEMGIEFARGIISAFQGIIDSARVVGGMFNQYIRQPLVQFRRLVHELNEEFGIQAVNDPLGHMFKLQKDEIDESEKQFRGLMEQWNRRQDTARLKRDDPKAYENQEFNMFLDQEKRIREIKEKYKPKLAAAATIESVSDKIVKLKKVEMELAGQGDKALAAFGMHQRELNVEFDNMIAKRRELKRMQDDPNSAKTAMGIMFGGGMSEAHKITDRYRTIMRGLEGISGDFMVEIGVKIRDGALRDALSKNKKELIVDVPFIGQEDYDKAKALKAEFEHPTTKLFREINEIMVLQWKDLIDDRTAALAVGEKWKAFGGEMRPNVELPSALEYRSVEAESAMNQWRAQVVSPMDGIRRAIEDSTRVEERIYEIARDIAIEINRVRANPPAIKLPGN